MANLLPTDEQIKELVHQKSPLQAPPEDGCMKEGLWYKYPLNSICADGSQGSLYAKRGAGSDLAIVFAGGGACWDVESMRYPICMHAYQNGLPALYMANSGELADFFTFMSGVEPGLMSASESNPFRDWNVAIITYATADFHLGTADVPYTDLEGNERIFHCAGYENFRASMEQICKLFSAPEHLLVTGVSAGAFSVPALVGEIADAFPQCKNVTALADSALTVHPGWPDVVQNLWKVPQPLAEAAHTPSLCADWFEWCHAQQGDRVKLLYAGSTHDIVFASFERHIRGGDFVTTKEGCDTCYTEMQELVSRLRNGNPDLNCFIYNFPDGIGTKHCMVLSPQFLMENNGHRPCDWLMDMICGRSYDVGVELLAD